MIAASPFKFEVWEDSGFSIMGRVLGPDATNVTQAGVTSIAFSVYDKANLAVALSTGTMTVSTVIFDTLQTDARWTVDSTGYNFRYDAPNTLLPRGSATYRLEVAFTPASGSPFHTVYEATTKDLLRS
jgi:cystathionine beta-lyase/cystathionine gamma-synthase